MKSNNTNINHYNKSENLAHDSADIEIPRQESDPIATEVFNDALNHVSAVTSTECVSAINKLEEAMALGTTIHCQFRRS